MSEKIRHAGSIFLGAHTPEVIGDYIGGPNHVLPTNRTARFASGLSVYDFMKRTTYAPLRRPKAFRPWRRRRRHSPMPKTSPRTPAPSRSAPTDADMNDVQNNRIAEISLDQGSIVRWSREVDHERQVAIFDLLENNSFALVDGFAGPYRIELSLARGQSHHRRRQ